MKKICYITTIPGTLSSFIVPTAEYLVQNTDWDITFICNTDEHFANEIPEGTHYIPIPLDRGISLGGSSAMLNMVRIFRREKFDLVQYSTPNAALYASIASSLAGIKRRKYHLMGFRYLGMQGVAKFIFKFIETVTCALSSEIECVSPSNMELGIREHIFPRKKAHVILNGSSAGVDLSRFDISKKPVWRTELREKFNIAESDCVFGFAGRITGDKGINELLKAFFDDDFSGSKLFLIGKIEQEETLDPSLLTQARNDSRLIWHPYVQDIERYFSLMDVLVLPSYREGFGNIVIEAEAMGVPVIVSDIPGPTDAMLANETGLVVKKADAEDLRRGMETLMRDPALRSKMGNAAYTFAKDKFEQQQLFSEILADRKHLLGE